MKNLNWSEGVKKSPAILRAAECMDSFFDGEPSEITSGLRTATDQVKIIIEKAVRHNVEKEFPEFLENMTASPEHTVHVEGRDLYWFQRTWSRLLALGDLVNPPIPAEQLFDYFRPGSDKNKKGEIIQLSNHQRGLSLDIGGGANLTEKAKRVMKALQSGECFLRNFLVEHINHAVHCDLIQI